MAKYFNHKKIELLAPSGNMDTFKQIVKANCDAIYLGGKSLNMRMIRKGYNFSNEEIKEAVNMAHDSDKKVYVTVNNMLNDSEIDEAAEYLHYLESVNVDGIIVQDLGVVQLCKEQNIKKIEIHSSVMMNVHNMDFVKALKEDGLTRVVLSREMDLKTAKLLQTETGVETEYFMHGDMCSVNGANCYFSSIAMGNSSNRGRCFKPCRWSYRVKKDGNVYPTEYPLAAKDMYMYEHIPELIEANVTSFKIEGRMREPGFIVDLVNTYGDAIDRYIEDPLSYDRKKHAEELYENRKRDFSTAYAFSNPGLDFINTRYEGTGKFYSTGKVFSTPTEEPEISEKALNKVHEKVGVESSTTKTDLLSVKVNNLEQAQLCIELGVKRIYLATEVFLPDTFMTVEQLRSLIETKKNTEIYLSLPQMMDELQCELIDQYLEKQGHLFDGILATNLGSIKKYAKKYNVITDYNVNIYNRKAMDYYKKLGVKESTVSIEMKGCELPTFMKYATNPVELIVHGPLRVMYLDLDLYENTRVLDPVEHEDNQFVNNEVLVLKSDKGESPVYIDQNKKNHLFTAKELCLLPVLQDIQFESLKSYRIEGQTYSLDELRVVIQIYKKALNDKTKTKKLFEQFATTRAGFTLGALSF
ncbi:U32 family peptidase [Evansella cellulosilytica]|nr:U32 family peptidase [Evansella cellulosilytica]